MALKAAAASKAGKTARLQVKVDRTTERIIRDMVRLSIHGTSRSEVAASIIRQWLWQNQAQLRENGISIAAQPSKREGAETQ